MKLPYFDCVRFTIIDPMHNLFTGTAKYILKKVWLKDESPKLSKEGLKKIQSIIDSFDVPATVGRIPHKISTNISTFTADQWNNWILYYSLISLHNILDTEDLACWQYFVHACSGICTPAISVQMVTSTHQLFMDFFKKYEILYGNREIVQLHPIFIFIGILKSAFWIMGQFMGFGFLDLRDLMVCWVIIIPTNAL